MVDLNYSDPIPCKILIWGGLGGEEWAWRDLAKNFASKFSDWLDRVLLTTSRVLFRSVPDEIFGRPVRHRIARLKFWFRRVVWLPKFWVGDTPTSATDVRGTCVVFSFRLSFSTAIKTQQLLCFWLLSSSIFNFSLPKLVPTAKWNKFDPNFQFQ